MIRVLVVDDSAVAREVLSHLINAAGDMTVIGTASDGIEAVLATQRLRPDIITMDITMPRMSGPEAIEQIMHTIPTPIVVVTGNTITEEVRATFRSLESGALAIVPRPAGPLVSPGDTTVDELIHTLRLMSEIKVVRRLKLRGSGRPGDLQAPRHPRSVPPRIVAIGASTGGPTALVSLLAELPRDYPLPVLVVQHIAAGFVEGFAEWLTSQIPLPVRVARAGDALTAGRVLVAPEASHLGVDGRDRVLLLPEGKPRLDSLCPSVDVLFRSVATAFGPAAIGVLLTGMGSDGATGLLEMRRAGAATVAQDRESSVVHGMPGHAIQLGAAEHVLPPARIGQLLNLLAQPASTQP